MPQLLLLAALLFCMLGRSYGGRILVPLYEYPGVTSGTCTGTSYKRLGNSAKANSIIVILNPNNGPNASSTAIRDYKVCITYLQSRGIAVVGYVHTKVGFSTNQITAYRPLSAVQADIAQWNSSYGTINGTFIDEVSTIFPQSYDISIANVISYYTTLITYTQSIFKNALVILNPGNPFFPSLIQGMGCNVLAVLFESSYSRWKPIDRHGCADLIADRTTEYGSFPHGPWCPFVPIIDTVEVLKNALGTSIMPCQAAALIYSAPNTSGVAAAVWRQAKAQSVDNLYLTERGLDSSWTKLASDPLWTEQTQQL